MGRILQIRVSAWTYDEDEVTGAWPRLTAFVWSQTERWGPPGMRRGVLELAEFLPDAVKFGLEDEALKSAAEPDVQKAAGQLEKLREALAAWDPREANRISTALEDTLDRLEQTFAEHDAER